MNSKKTKFAPPIPDPISDQINNDYSSYDRFADNVGMVLNIRKSDNKLQAKVLLITWLACVIVGVIWDRTNGAMLGALLGLVVGLLVSGGVLTVVGLLRK